MNDFVSFDDYVDRTSESDVSTTSSMTSYDHQRASSNICQLTDNEETNVNGKNSASKDEKFRPAVAPKPKLPSGGDSNGEAELFKCFPAPPSYSDATAEKSLQLPSTKNFGMSASEGCEGSGVNGEM